MRNPARQPRLLTDKPVAAELFSQVQAPALVHWHGVTRTELPFDLQRNLLVHHCPRRPSVPPPPAGNFAIAAGDAQPRPFTGHGNWSHQTTYQLSHGCQFEKAASGEKMPFVGTAEQSSNGGLQCGRVHTAWVAARLLSHPTEDTELLLLGYFPSPLQKYTTKYKLWYIPPTCQVGNWAVDQVNLLRTAFLDKRAAPQLSSGVISKCEDAGILFRVGANHSYTGAQFMLDNKLFLRVFFSPIYLSQVLKVRPGL